MPGHVKRTDTLNRLDPRNAVRRDEARIARRVKGQHHFWRSLAIVGTVGWPISLATIAGVACGRWLDNHWGTGLHMTLLFMTLGVVIGSISAWQSISAERED